MLTFKALNASGLIPVSDKQDEERGVLANASEHPSGKSLKVRTLLDAPALEADSLVLVQRKNWG